MSRDRTLEGGCGLIDCLQFPDVVEFCEEMANMGKTVIVAALDGTFQRQVRMRCSIATWVPPIMHGILSIVPSVV